MVLNIFNAWKLKYRIEKKRQILLSLFNSEKTFHFFLCLIKKHQVIPHRKSMSNMAELCFRHHRSHTPNC